MSRELARIDELAALEYGWHDGEGFAPTTYAIAAARKLAGVLQPELYTIYPRLCGGIQFEPRAEGSIEFCIEPYGLITVDPS